MIIKATKYGHQKGTDEVFLFTNNINAILVQRGESCILLGRYRAAFLDFSEQLEQCKDFVKLNYKGDEFYINKNRIFLMMYERERKSTYFVFSDRSENSCLLLPSDENDFDLLLK